MKGRIELSAWPGEANASRPPTQSAVAEPAICSFLTVMDETLSWKSAIGQWRMWHQARCARSGAVNFSTWPVSRFKLELVLREWLCVSQLPIPKMIASVHGTNCTCDCLAQTLV